MRLLLDSHVLIWCLESPERLTRQAQQTIADPRNQVFFSAASIWELALKAAKGKLRLPETFLDDLITNGFDPLPVRVEHAMAVITMIGSEHADPFDRMLLSQAKIEGLLLVTRDAHLKAYGIPLLEV
jgi:PIN domain nuclease of toxin-antitoxin system